MFLTSNSDCTCGTFTTVVKFCDCMVRFSSTFELVINDNVKYDFEFFGRVLCRAGYPILWGALSLGVPCPGGSPYPGWGTPEETWDQTLEYP